MPYLLQTPRLTLRPINENDYPLLRSMHLNEKMNSLAGPALLRTEEQSQTGFKYCLQIEKDDPRLGSWITEIKPSQLPIGSVILRKPATKDPMEGLEIGYSFYPEYWGMGLAQESVRAMVEYALREFGPMRIIALVSPVNTASRNVLIKTGFISVGVTDYVNPSTGNVSSTELLELHPSSP